MAVFYVDLSIAMGGAGSSIDPFGLTDFVAHTNIAHASNNEYRLKGIGDAALDTLLLNSAESNVITVRAWDLATFGPWRLHCKKLVIHQADIIEQSIIETDGDMMLGIHHPTTVVRDSYLHNTAGIMIIRRVEGCSLIGTGSAKIYVGQTTQFYDSTVDHTYLIDVDESQVQFGHSATVIGDMSFPDIG